MRGEGAPARVAAAAAVAAVLSGRPPATAASVTVVMAFMFLDELLSFVLRDIVLSCCASGQR